MVKGNRFALRLRRLLGSLRPGVLPHLFRMIHHWGYSHVLPRARMTLGPNVRIAPTASFRNGERIALGA